jgi:hypothetical protein
MGGLFLPFTPNGKATELLAVEVKKHLELGPTTPVDPFAILSRVPARLVEPHELSEGLPAVAHVLFVEECDDWSGVGLGESPVDGASLILLNPSHAITRRRATLIEEIVHIVSGHPKSLLTRGAGGTSWRRSHDESVEDEAYTVGAACILPYPEMFNSIHREHESAASIADRFGVSVAYVEFRIKRAGLERIYRKHCPPIARRPSFRVR